MITDLRVVRILFGFIVLTSLKSYAQTPITWTNPINVSVNGDNSVSKSGGISETWDATIVSQNVIPSGQDGSIEFVYQPGTSRYMISLSKLNNDVDYATSDYSFYLNKTVVKVYAQSDASGPFTVAAGSTIKISREVKQIKFYVNTTVIKTYTLTNNLDNLRVDVSLATGSTPVITASFPPALTVVPAFQFPSPGNNNGSITLTTEGQVNPVTYAWSSSETTASINGKPRGAYTVTATDASSRTVTKTYGLGYPVIWSNQTQVILNANNTMTKTGADGWGVSGAFSNNILFPNTDGWLEFVVTDVSSDYTIGFSRVDTDQSNASIDYGWKIGRSGLASIYESNSSKITAISIMKGDVFRISREAGVFKYYLNGVLKRSISGDGEYTYNVDVAIFNNLGPVPCVTTSFPTNFTLSPTFQFPGLANNNGSISLQPEGQLDPVSYSWSTSETASSIVGKTIGSYTVTASDVRSPQVSRTYYLGYPITWSNLKEVTVGSDNTLTKTGVDGWGISGASSLNRLAASTDGWMEFVVKDLAASYMIGLSRVDRDANYTTIHYAIQVTTNITRIFENGQATGFKSGVVKGDVFRIARDGTSLKYYINGVLARSVTIPATYSFIIDVAMYGQGSTPVVTSSFDKTISVLPDLTLPDDANMNGSIALNIQGSYTPHSVSWSSGETSSTITAKPRGTYTATITDAASRILTRNYRLGYAVEWADLINANVDSKNVVHKSVGDGNGLWDAGANSTNILAPSTDGWIEYVPTVSISSAMIGLARANSTANYTNMDYAFLAVNGVVYIYESGVNRGVFGNQMEGTVLTISRELNNNIKYYINGEVVRTVATNATYALIVDCSINWGEASFVTASFPRTSHTFYSIANGNWTTPSVWSLTENGPPATAYPGISDHVVIKGHDVLVNSGVNAANINMISNSNTCLTIEGAQGVVTVTGGDVTIESENNSPTVDAMVVRNGGRIVVN